MANFNEKIADTNTYIQEMVAAAQAAGAKIQTGSYIGTGTYGQANPCSLTFDFEPLLIMGLGHTSTTELTQDFGFTNTGETNNYSYLISIPLLTETYKNKMGLSALIEYSYAKKSSDGKTVYWYTTYNAGTQYNDSDRTYFCLAIGF